MSEQQYKLEENNQTNELILWEDAKILNVFKNSYDNRKHLNIIVDRLNEQQSIIEQLQEENKELKHWKKRIIDYLTDWFNKTEYLTVLYKINEINNEIGLDSDE